jgi:hypothetical protein
MARPLRIESAGAYYHVTNRGDQRQAVFTGPWDLDNPLARLEGQMTLGTEPFVHRIRRAYVLKRHADRREQPAFARARQSVPFEAVARCVGQVCRVDPDGLLTLRGSDRRARHLLVYGVCQYCRGGESLTALAQRFGISLSGLTMARDRVAESLRHDKTLLQV